MTGLTLVTVSPALAQATTYGGAGGVQPNGGVSSITGDGGVGGDAANPTLGGGGGGAGVRGGTGGAGVGGTVQGGGGGQLPGEPGSSGHDGGSGSGGGGGGGAHGSVVTSDTTNSVTIAGGDGGKGGTTSLSDRTGGGGGAGGYGGVVNGSGITYTNSGSIGGGAGGAGGANLSTGAGGSGGDGGHGLYFTGAGVLNNTGSITGGAGGAEGNSGSGAHPAGGNGGLGVYFGVAGTINNSGSISGGAGGFGFSAGAAGGAGIEGSDLTIVNSGSISGALRGDGLVRANAITFTGGSNVLELQAGSTITGNVVGTGADALRLGGASNATFDVSSIGSSAQYQGFSTFVKTGSSTWTLTNTTTAATPWTINQGTLTVSADAALGASTGALAFGGGTLQWGASFDSTRGITLNSGGGTLDTQANDATLSGNIAGTGGLTKLGAGELHLGGSNTYSGATNVNGGVLQAWSSGAFSSASAFTIAAGATLDLHGNDETIGSLGGAGTVTTNAASATLATGADNTSTIFSGTITDGLGLGLTKIGTGTLTLTGANTYSGATTVNGGTLEVDGSIANSSSVTVNSGAMLSGSGIVDPATTTIMSGGTLAPGNAANPTGTLTITGNLAFQSGALYLVHLTPSAAASTSVTGTAILGGATVNANFAGGSYINKTYTILTASGGVSGSFAPTVANSNLPANFRTGLDYDANHAYLDLALNYTPAPTAPNFGSGLSGNQQAVANALVNSFNANGGIPLVYGGLTATGLSQASGELGTASQQTTFDAMSQFMGLLTDPFINRPGAASSAPRVSGFAEEGDRPSAAASRKADAFAMFTNAPPAAFQQRWSVWGAGFGGSQSTNGNASVGSDDTTSSIYGTAVGADYLLSPNTLAGFSLAGGGTNFSVVNGGSGRSDLFQVGGYLHHTNGPAYIAAALAYGWQDITTDRYLAIAGLDHLRAEFNANAWSGRFEGGYRFVSPFSGGVGLTPYAAAQFTTLELPAYAEQATFGSSSFALAYGAKSVTDVRTELGLRTDKSFALDDSILTLRGRVAWAHDYDPDRSIAATFQSLPGASFVVNGAAQATDSALTTASAEIRWSNGWSGAATFEGEFSNVTTSCAGKGTIRYAW